MDRLLVKRADRPAVELIPPPTIVAAPKTAVRRRSGQAEKGGIPRAAGNPIRRAATLCRSRACTNALVKCVVPIMTAWTLAAFAPVSFSSASIAALMPELTSRDVGRLTAATVSRPSIRTASVFVPPTSTPISRRSLEPCALGRGKVRSWVGATISARRCLPLLSRCRLDYCSGDPTRNGSQCSCPSSLARLSASGHAPEASGRCFSDDSAPHAR